MRNIKNLCTYWVLVDMEAKDEMGIPAGQISCHVGWPRGQCSVEVVTRPLRSWTPITIKKKNVKWLKVDQHFENCREKIMRNNKICTASFDEKNYEKQQRCNVTWRSNFRKKPRETVLVKCFVSGLQWGDIRNTTALFILKNLSHCGLDWRYTTWKNAVIEFDPLYNDW